MPEGIAERHERLFKAESEKNSNRKIHLSSAPSLGSALFCLQLRNANPLPAEPLALRPGDPCPQIFRRIRDSGTILPLRTWIVSSTISFIPHRYTTVW